MGNPLYDALRSGLDRRAGAFILALDGSTVDSDRFLELAARYATVLEDCGVLSGDRVAVQVEKSWQALALYVACLRAGAVFLPLNTAYTTHELEHFLNDAEPVLVVVDPARALATEALVARLAGPEGRTSRVLELDAAGAGGLAERAAAASPAARVVDRRDSDLAAILYTSGTTGLSKGAMLSQGNLLSNAQTLVDAWRFTADDVLLHALPIFHTHGLFVACHTIMLCGGSLSWHPRFDVDALIADLPRVTTMMGVPTFYTRLLADERFDAERASAVRLFVSGSAPLLAETHRAFEVRTGQRILERYGMTETNMNCSNPYEGERRAGTVGMPLPGVEVRVVDLDNGEAVPIGGVGLLEVRGPNVFEGYWRLPEKTAEELHADGFFATGDLVSIDADGYVTIVGRGKDLVISGGYNIYPKEIELVIDELPGVMESAVVGVPHADLGEALVAFVVRSDGHGRQPVEADVVLEGLCERLARFKCPRQIEFIDALPRNTMGKVQKNELRSVAAERMANRRGR